MSSIGRLCRRAVFLAAAVCFSATALALEPDEIALVVNKQVPASRTLAESYARQRQLPPNRIIEIDLNPVDVDRPAEEMPFNDYQPQVAKPVREFLEKNQLQRKVKCLVTFWGVPLRIGRRVLTDAEKDELKKIENELKATVGDPLKPDRGTIIEQVRVLEAMATSLAPPYRPPVGDDLNQLSQRVNLDATAIVQALTQSRDQRLRNDKFPRMIAIVEHLVGSKRVRQMMVQPAVARLAPRPVSKADADAAEQELLKYLAQMEPTDPYDPTPSDRERARQISFKHLGRLGYANVLYAQAQAFGTEQSESALDSELSLVWWKGYNRAKWVQNPLHYKFQANMRKRQMAPSVPLLMVTRLDGPSVQIVSDVIATSIKVEAAGIQGQVALDARGRAPIPPEQWDEFAPNSDHYAVYDQSIRNLANLLRQKTRLDLTFDDKDSLIPENSLKNIAVYCGWYSLQHYVKPGTFAPGAVGFHIASSELVSLHNPNEKGWVRGLMNDGVVAALGPVAEPFLESFPFADEFVPLLMTGRLTLAEVYWRTVPMTSWMLTCVGDPLYNPYKAEPPLRAADLPPPLQGALMSNVEPPAATQATNQ